MGQFVDDGVDASGSGRPVGSTKSNEPKLNVRRGSQCRRRASLPRIPGLATPMYRAMSCLGQAEVAISLGAVERLL